VSGAPSRVRGVNRLESFLISPDAVAQARGPRGGAAWPTPRGLPHTAPLPPPPWQALKVKLGCTTAVLKLPGNNVKEQEVLLQGHCLNEVVDYLRDAYCIDKKWVVLPTPKKSG